MHNRACSWKLFGIEDVNESQKQLKSSEKDFYPTFSLFWAKLSEKNLFLIRSEILGLLVKTLTANYEYSRSNRENLPLRIQMQLSKKPKVICCIFVVFSEYTLNFQFFEKKVYPHQSSISWVFASEKCAYLNAYYGLFLETLWQWTC